MGVDLNVSIRTKLAATERFREVAQTSMIPAAVAMRQHSHCYTAMTANGCVPATHEMEDKIVDKQPETILISNTGLVENITTML